MRLLPPRGVTAGDVLLGLAIVALVAAMAHPRLERALMRRTAAAARADVETVRAAAVATLKEAGAWPAPAGPGEVPTELAGRLPPDFSFQEGRYTLEWGRWETVGSAATAVAELPPEDLRASAPPTYRGSVPPPPGESLPEVEVPVETLGAVTVHSDDERVLAALLERFGAARSFVRERSWTLVLLPAGDGASPTPER